MLNSKGKSYHILELHIAWLKELSCLKNGRSISNKAQLKPVHVLGNIYFLMHPSDLDELCEWVRNKRVFLIDKNITIDGLLEYEEQCSSSRSSISSLVLEITNEEHIMIISTTSQFAVSGKSRGVLF